MATTIIVGDGPAGLSAGILLGKCNETVEIFGDNDTNVHDSYLYNYPGIRQLDGSTFVRNARAQCQYFGTNINDRHIESIKEKGDRYLLTDTQGDCYHCNYLILATGFSNSKPNLSFELETDSRGTVEIDDHSRTSKENVYAAGAVTRTRKIQVSISVGQGASAALDIIETERSDPPRDFDSRALSHLKETGPQEAPWLPSE